MLVDVLEVRLALGDQHDRRAVGDGLVERLDRLVAAYLEGHDHLREDDRLAERDERELADAALDRRRVGLLGLFDLLLWVDGVRHFAPWRSKLVSSCETSSFAASSSPLPASAGVLVGFLSCCDVVLVKGFEDAHSEALLELEQHAHPCEVDAQVACQMADPEDPPDIVLRVETNVGARSRRADQTLQLVDAQRSWMDTDQLCGHADHVYRTRWIPFISALVSHGR